VFVTGSLAIDVPSRLQILGGRLRLVRSVPVRRTLLTPELLPFDPTEFVEREGNLLIKSGRAIGEDEGADFYLPGLQRRVSRARLSFIRSFHVEDRHSTAAGAAGG